MVFVRTPEERRLYMAERVGVDPRIVHEWEYHVKDTLVRYRLVHNGERDRLEALVVERYGGLSAMRVEQWVEVTTVRCGAYAHRDRDEVSLDEALILELWEIKRRGDLVAARAGGS